MLKLDYLWISWFHMLFPVVLQLGSTAIGIQTSEGVCLAVEKRITSSLMEPSSIEKIVEIDTHIGKEVLCEPENNLVLNFCKTQHKPPCHLKPLNCTTQRENQTRRRSRMRCKWNCLSTGCAMSGLIADAKTLIDKARVETQVGVGLCLISYSDIRGSQYYCFLKLWFTVECTYRRITGLPTTRRWR